MYSNPLQKLIDKLSKLPSVGPRQASRIAFYLLKRQDRFLEELIEDLKNLKQQIGICQECFLSYEKSSGKKCEFCQNPKRNKNTICVVQKEMEVQNIENAKIYEGVYHILGENIDILQKDMPYSVKKLLDRIDNLKKQTNKEIEVILATNPTTEGTATALYIKKFLEPKNIKITTLARGLSFGSELEYQDQQTISSAFLNRK